MDFNVKVGKSLTHNALFNRANKDAAYKQTDLEHHRLQNQFIRPGMSAPEVIAARKRGIAAEKNEKKYWHEQKPRADFSPSSSFIENVHIIPSLRLARITMNGRTYSYPLDDKTVGDMVTSSSLGQYYNKNIKL